MKPIICPGVICILVATFTAGVADAQVQQPRIEPGSIQTNATILCESTDGPFQAGHNQWFQLDYGESGPNMEWKGQTSCFAMTTATNKGTGSVSTYRSTVTIANRVGGTCGWNGTNHLGSGQTAALYRTIVHLPQPRFGQWYIDFQILGVTAPGRIEPANYEIRFYESGEDRTFTVPMDNAEHSREIRNVAPGVYTFDLQVPRVYRSCQGSPHRTVSESTFRTNAVISIYLR